MWLFYELEQVGIWCAWLFYELEQVGIDVCDCCMNQNKLVLMYVTFLWARTSWCWCMWLSYELEQVGVDVDF